MVVKSIDFIADEKFILREISILDQIRIMAVNIGQTQIHLVMEFFHSLNDVVFNEGVQIIFKHNEFLSRSFFSLLQSFLYKEAITILFYKKYQSDSLWSVCMAITKIPIYFKS